MDISDIGIYNGVGLSGTILGGMLKFVIGLLLFGVLLYSFLLIIKLRVLQDTVEASGNTAIKRVSFINLIITLIGSLLSIILILL